MIINNNALEQLYRIYNNFDFDDGFVVYDHNTIIEVLKESKESKFDLRKRIVEIECKKINNSNFQILDQINKTPQPKSVFIRFYYILLIINSIPEEKIDCNNINYDCFTSITLAIILHYYCLQLIKFSEFKTELNGISHLIGRQDFYITYEEILMLSGYVKKEDFDKYVSLFAENINNDDIGDCKLYLDDNGVFILCIEEFVDYILFKLEKIILSELTKKATEKYRHNKGELFEEYVYSLTASFFDKSFHTLYYYPAKDKKVEIDVLVEINNRFAVIECKSGTINLEDKYTDSSLRSVIKGKTKKAYKSLMDLNEYYTKQRECEFICDSNKVHICDAELYYVNMLMYSLDSFSSNLHVMYGEYLDNDTQILTISLEHFLAILIDQASDNNNIFDYLKKRTEYISKYPKLNLDSNELDLYYEIKNEGKGSMLGLLEEKGILEKLPNGGTVISSFHDEYGNEWRPSIDMIQKLDSILLMKILEQGKRTFGINKRFINNFKQIIIKDVYRGK